MQNYVANIHPVEAALRRWLRLRIAETDVDLRKVTVAGLLKPREVDQMVAPVSGAVHGLRDLPKVVLPSAEDLALMARPRKLIAEVLLQAVPGSDPVQGPMARPRKAAVGHDLMDLLRALALVEEGSDLVRDVVVLRRVETIAAHPRRTVRAKRVMTPMKSGPKSSAN